MSDRSLVRLNARGTRIEVPRETFDRLPSLLANIDQTAVDEAETGDGSYFVNAEPGAVHAVIDYLTVRKPGQPWRWELFDRVGFPMPLPDDGQIRVVSSSGSVAHSRLDLDAALIEKYPTLRDRLVRDSSGRFDTLPTTVEIRVIQPEYGPPLPGWALAQLEVPLAELTTLADWRLWRSAIDTYRTTSPTPVYRNQSIGWKIPIDPSWYTTETRETGWLLFKSTKEVHILEFDGQRVEFTGRSAGRWRRFDAKYDSVEFLSFPKNLFPRFSRMYERETGAPLRKM